MSYKPKNVLVTGGAGFIGAHFVHYLLACDAGVKIVNLDLLTYAGNPDNLSGLPDPGRHLLVQGDICDQALVSRLLREHEIDTVVHFAAESHVDRSIAGPAEFVRTNVIGTFTLLEAARNYWFGERGFDASSAVQSVRFHHISTDEVFGTLSVEDPPFRETTAYSPNSPYSASKAGSDHLVRAYQHTYGLPTITTNTSNNYGPLQHREKFIPTVINACLQGKPIPVYGNGSNIRDWLYVVDHCRGIDLAIRKGRPGETYNIGGSNEWNNIDVVRLICRLMDEQYPAGAPHDRLISFVTDRPGHDWRYAIDARKAKAELEWQPTTSMAEGLLKTIRFFSEALPATA